MEKQSPSSFSELMEIARKKELQKFESTPRKDFPHIAVLTFKIEVRSLANDNTMGESILSNQELRKFGMSDKAKIHIKGATESECICKVKNMLENLNVESRKWIC